MERKTEEMWLDTLVGAAIGIFVVELLLRLGEIYATAPIKERPGALFLGGVAGAIFWSVASIISQITSLPRGRFLFSVAGGILLELLTILFCPSILQMPTVMMIFLIVFAIPIIIALLQLALREFYEWD